MVHRKVDSLRRATVAQIFSRLSTLKKFNVKIWDKYVLIFWGEYFLKNLNFDCVLECTHSARRVSRLLKALKKIRFTNCKKSSSTSGNQTFKSFFKIQSRKMKTLCFSLFSHFFI